MDTRLEKIEIKLDKLIEGFAALSVSHQHLCEDFKKISEETDQNTIYRTQSKAVIVAMITVISLIGVSTVLQFVEAIARPSYHMCKLPGEDKEK